MCPVSSSVNGIGVRGAAVHNARRCHSITVPFPGVVQGMPAWLCSLETVPTAGGCWEDYMRVTVHVRGLGYCLAGRQVFN